MEFPTEQMRQDEREEATWRRQNGPILDLTYARSQLIYWEHEAERLENKLGYPKKWARFENTPQNRIRFRVGGSYKIRFIPASGGQSEIECFIRQDESVKGLPVLFENGEAAIPFQAIRKVKRVA